MLEREMVGFEGGGGWTFVVVVMLMRDRWRWGGRGRRDVYETYLALAIIVGSDYRNEK